jgi:excisionase family DNA binding protein
MNPPFLTVDEVAAVLCVGTKTVRRYIAEGKIVARRVGRRYLVPRTYLEALFQVARPDADEELRRLAMLAPDEARVHLHQRASLLERHLKDWLQRVSIMGQATRAPDLPARVEALLAELDGLRAEGRRLLRSLRRVERGG